MTPSRVQVRRLAALVLVLSLFPWSESRGGHVATAGPAEQSGSFNPIRINSGGGSYTDLAGREWSADIGFSGGQTAETSTPIANTDDDALYQSERFGDFTYLFGVPNATYTVVLRFAETFWAAPGQRVFNVLIEGQSALTNFDILSEGGTNTAVDRAFTVPVVDGNLQITFGSVVDNAEVTAIEIIQTGPPPAITPTPTPTPVGGFGPIRVNSGGPDYTDLAGRPWAADTGFDGGGTSDVGTPIGDTSDDSLYQTERFGNFGYSFAVPAGIYTVTLKFAETFWTSPGQRVFNVQVEGQPILTNFDILSVVGPNTALDRTFSVTATDGNLDIAFSTVVDTASVTAIEIVRAGAPPSCSPRPPVTLDVDLAELNLIAVDVIGETTSGAPNNRLQALRVLATTNASIDYGGQSGQTGSFVILLPERPQELTFFVRRLGPGAATVSLVVVDDCGEWPTFVGGGPDAWAPGSGGARAGSAPTAAPSPAAVANRTPTPVAPPGAATARACTPRPEVGVAAAPDDPGRLRVTVTARTTAGAPNNRLRALRFGNATNALIDAGDQAGRSGGFTVELGGGVQQATFVVRRATPGQATNVPLVVVDDCGEWPTVVGGGPGAF